MGNQTYLRRPLMRVDLGDQDVPCDYDECEKQAEFVAGMTVARWVVGVHVCADHAQHWEAWRIANDGRARMVRPTPIVGRRITADNEV